MHDATIAALVRRRKAIHARWETLLKGERVNTPLARPELLVYLMDPTLDNIFAALRHLPRTAVSWESGAGEAERASCACGRNPLLVFFLSGEQALLEELIHLQAEAPSPAPSSHAVDVTELYLVLRREARLEVRAFCAVCVHSPDHASAAESARQAR